MAQRDARLDDKYTVVLYENADHKRSAVQRGLARGTAFSTARHLREQGKRVGIMREGDPEGVLFVGPDTELYP